MATIAAATILAILMQSATEPKKTDRDYDGLTGQVHIVGTDRERTVQSGSDKRKVIRERAMVAVYDRNGWLIEELSFGFEDCTLSRHVFRFDTTDKRAETVYWGKGVADTNTVPPKGPAPVGFKQVFTFESSGNRSEVTDYDPFGKLLSKTRYKYDDKGKVSETTSDFGSTRSQCSFKYDDLGFVEEESCRRTGGLESAEKSSYKYEIDSVGNWIKRTGDSATSFNGKPSSHDLPVTYRTIEYYQAEANPASDTVGASGDILSRLALKPCSGPLVIRKSGGVLQQSATKRITPAYPLAALAQRITGSVLVELTIDEMGKVISTRTISGPAELHGAAEQAAKAWEFAPTYLSKVPVKVIGTINFNFNR